MKENAMRRTILKYGIILLACLAFSSIASAETDDNPALELINSQGCKACHTLAGDGGVVSESFENMRGKLSAAEVRLQLVNPEKTHGEGTIPDFSHLSEKNIETLVNFIQPKS